MKTNQCNPTGFIGSNHALPPHHAWPCGGGLGKELTPALTLGAFGGTEDKPKGSPLVWGWSGEGMARNVCFDPPSLETGREARRH